MNIKIKYLGLIAEITNKTDEVLLLEETRSITSINDILTKLYPSLSNTKYKIALNQVFTSNDTLIIEGDEIALLPPFAGG